MLNWEFHHFGLATAKADLTIRFVESMGYRVGEEVIDPLQNVRLRMCYHTVSPAVEIIYPHEPNGPLDKMLQTQQTSIYHTCYECESISGTVESIKAAGFRAMQVSAPKPAILFHNRYVAFYMVNGFGLIELLER